MKHTISLLFVFCLILPPIVYGADSEGRYWLGGGAGSVSCPQFVSSMETGRASGIGSLPFVNETQGFTMYISGFQTGYNASKPKTCDIFAEAKGEYELLTWVENYCRSNPSKRFGDGVVSLGKAFHPKRKQVCAQ